MLNLTPYLEDIERRIDEKEEEAIYRAWVDFSAGNAPVGEDFRPPRRKPKESGQVWKHVNVNDTLADEDLMILSQLENCNSSLGRSSDSSMRIRANYGVGIIASLFGARKFIMPYDMDTLPNVRCIEGGSEGIERLLDAGEPSLETGFGAQVMSVAERFAEIRRRYPKIGRWVRIDNPDAQGPIDNCELLWGSDIFYALYDEAELVHALLRRVTDTVKRFLDQWKAIVSNGDGMTCYFASICRGGIFLRNDSAMNLSPEFYREFCAPYDAELLEYFGGGGVHFCGRGDHFVKQLAKLPMLAMVDMSQPHLNRMDIILSELVDKGINLACPRGDYSIEGHAKHRLYYT